MSFTCYGTEQNTRMCISVLNSIFIYLLRILSVKAKNVFRTVCLKGGLMDYFMVISLTELTVPWQLFY